MAGVLRSVHAANRERHSIELILADREGSIQFFVECPLELRALLLVHLLDAFPGAKLERCADSLFQLNEQNKSQFVLLRPHLEFEFLRRQFDQHDPMTAVLSWTAPGLCVWLDLLLIFWWYGFDFIGVDSEFGETFASCFSV